jgi:aldose 1-epimerase
MFGITSKIINGFELVELKNTTGETYAEVIPGCGAILHSFNIWHKGKHLNTIDNYTDKEDFEKNVTTQGFKSCKLSPFACRVKDAAYEFNGVKYVADKFLLGKNALHGLIYDASFSIVSRQVNESSATLVLKYEYRADEKGYPFNYDCIITYQLKAGNELLVATQVINKDEKSIPIQDGWHPYFMLGKKIDELELTLHSKEQVVFDSEIIPTREMKYYRDFFEGKKLGDHFFDDCFLLDLNAGQTACRLKDTENNIQIEIRPDNNYPYLQLYTPPHRNSIAIENLSAPPDTFNNGINLIVLDPGESANFATSFVITSLK